MTTPDRCEIWLPDAASTQSAGAALSRTIYGEPLTIGLTGELGAGKTTFLQGFFEALGVSQYVTSPTYALEQRYKGTVHDILHIDLYRINESQADELVHASDDFQGVRCIEWMDRSTLQPDILLHLEDNRDGRQLSIQFRDISLPGEETILAWREEMALPTHIRKHCDAVAEFSLELAKNHVCRPNALRQAALIHDLFRFIDFTPGASHEGSDPEEMPQWEPWKKKFAGMKHEAACADFLTECGYPELASIVRVHGLQLPSPKRSTIEQNILFYADKRVMQETVVTLEERFEDFRKRYGGGGNAEGWYEEAKEVEKKLGLTH